MIRNRHNASYPRLIEAIGLHGITCKFCEADELRICGREAETYLGCPMCGADGPVGHGIRDAVDRYQGRFPPQPRLRS